MALDAVGRRDEVVEFFDRYSEGPLTDIDDGAASRVRWWEQLYGERLSPSEARKLDDRTTWRRLRADTRTVVVEVRRVRQVG